MFMVYLLKNDNKSYIGYTNDFLRRWKQHNCILKGGAKYTTRNNIIGVKTQDNYQMVFLDTPGIHLKATRMTKSKE